MRAWHVDDGPDAPALRLSKNDPTAESAAGLRPTALVRRLLRCDAVADAPSPNPSVLPGCHRRCPKLAGRRGRHLRFASVVDRFRRFASASWAGAGRIVRLSAGW